MADPAPRHHHDGREHRAHFPNQGQGHRRTKQTLRPEFHQGIVPLQPQHHTRKRTGQTNDKNGLHADKIYLVNQLVRLEGKREEMDDSPDKEDCHPSQFLDGTDGQSAETGQHIRRYGSVRCQINTVCPAAFFTDLISIESDPHCR